MKAIKINEENKMKIENALKAVNGRSEAHAYTQASEIEAIAERAENELTCLVYKKDAAGAEYVSISGDAVSASYRGMRNGTKIVIQRRSTGWYLIDAEAVLLYAQGGGKNRLYLTERQNDAAIAYLHKNFFTVMKSVSTSISA